MEFYCRGAKESDFPEIDKTTRRAFNSDSGMSGSHKSWKQYKTPPLENIRVCVVKGEKDEENKSERVIAVSPIKDFEIHFGDRNLKAGGLYDVSTDPEFQGFGLGLKLQNDVAEYLTKHNYDIGILFTGSYPFYAKAGWIINMLSPSFRLPSNDNSNISENFKLNKDLSYRKFQNEDLDLLTRMYEEFNKDYYFTQVRDLVWWEHKKKDYKELFDNIFIVSKGEEVIGYIWLKLVKENDTSLCRLMEYSCKNKEYESELLNIAIHLAEEMKTDYLDITLHDIYPLVQLAKEKGAKDHTGMLSGRMIRIQNLAKLMPSIVYYLKDKLNFDKNNDIKNMNNVNMALEIKEDLILHILKDKNSIKIEIIDSDIEMIPNRKDIITIKIPEHIFISLIFSNQLASDLADEYDEEWEIENEEFLDVLDIIFSPMKGKLYDLDHF